MAQSVSGKNIPPLSGGKQEEVYELEGRETLAKLSFALNLVSFLSLIIVPIVAAVTSGQQLFYLYGVAFGVNLMGMINSRNIPIALKRTAEGFGVVPWKGSASCCGWPIEKIESISLSNDNTFTIVKTDEYVQQLKSKNKCGCISKACTMPIAKGDVEALRQTNGFNNTKEYP